MADHVGMDYEHWRIDRTFLLVPAQEYVGKFIATFKEFPPSQKVGSFSLDQVLGEQYSRAAGKLQPAASDARVRRNTPANE